MKGIKKRIIPSLRIEQNHILINPTIHMAGESYLSEHIFRLD